MNAEKYTTERSANETIIKVVNIIQEKNGLLYKDKEVLNRENKQG